MAQPLSIPKTLARRIWFPTRIGYLSIMLQSAGCRDSATKDGCQTAEDAR